MKIHHLVYYPDPEGSDRVEQIRVGRVQRYSAGNGYGFLEVKHQEPQGLFFHINNGLFLSPRHTGGLNFVPGFSQVPNEFMERIDPPRCGDFLAYLVGKDKDGRRDCAIAWAPIEKYKRAEDQCVVYRELELERLERNPRFRCIQKIIVAGQERVDHKPVFEGDKDRFETSYPLGAYNQWNKPDPLLTSKAADVTTIRWFQRETLEGWVDCEDPRKTRFMLTRHEARLKLRCAIMRTRGDAPGNVWVAPDGRGDLDTIAEASPEGTIRFPATANYLETIFTGKVAREILRDAIPQVF